MLIGILAIQGARKEHAEKLLSLGALYRYVKDLEDLEGIDGLIIPGGESTTIGKLINRNKLAPTLTKLIQEGLPVYGTCAGAILLAKKVLGDRPVKSLDLMDIEIERNAYGGQLDSFISNVHIEVVGPKALEAVFIRAPKIKKHGKNVQVLAECQGSAVLLRQGNMLVSSFHPELSEDTRVHEYFIKMINGQK